MVKFVLLAFPARGGGKPPHSRPHPQNPCQPARHVRNLRGGRQTALRHWTSRYGITFGVGRFGMVSHTRQVLYHGMVVYHHGQRTMYIREAVILPERRNHQSSKSAPNKLYCYCHCHCHCHYYYHYHLLYSIARPSCT